MTVFACTGCGSALTAPLDRVALPVHAGQFVFPGCGHELLPPLMEPGTSAVNPEPWGPRGVRGKEKAADRGVYVPVDSLSYGPRGMVVIAPGDLRGTVVIPDRCDGYCIGLDGRDGPNLACERCGRAVATRIDDCGYWQEVWLDPRATRPLPEAGPARQDCGWQALREERPPQEPIQPSGRWDPYWEVAVAVAPAHLPAVSGVPLSADVWLHLAFPPQRRPVPKRGGMPLQAYRDDPPPPLPFDRFRPNRRTFLATLARLPQVREPWLRAIYENARTPSSGTPF